MQTDAAREIQRIDEQEESYENFNDLVDKYDELISNPRNPLWSRFAMGTYAPGSTFKPVVASASLEEGAISADTIFNCGGTM